MWINCSNSGKLPDLSAPPAHIEVPFVITMITIILSCSSENSQREPKVHGKGYKGLILEPVGRLPSLGDTIQPSTLHCNIQLSHSQQDQEQHGVCQEIYMLWNLAVGEGTGGATYPILNYRVWRSHNMWTRASSLPGCGTWDAPQTSEQSVPKCSNLNCLAGLKLHFSYTAECT